MANSHIVQSILYSGSFLQVSLLCNNYNQVQIQLSERSVLSCNTTVVYLCSIRSPWELLSTYDFKAGVDCCYDTYPGAREEKLKKHVIVPVLWLE